MRMMRINKNHHIKKEWLRLNISLFNLKNKNKKTFLVFF